MRLILPMHVLSMESCELVSEENGSHCLSLVVKPWKLQDWHLGLEITIFSLLIINFYPA